MQDATKAMQQLNGLEIGGSAIRVQIASVAAGDHGAITYGELDEEDGKLFATNSLAASRSFRQLPNALSSPGLNLTCRCF